MSQDLISEIGGWPRKDAAELAEIANQPTGLRPMTLTAFFGAVLAAGGGGEDAGILGDVWGGQWLTRAESALIAGDLASITALLATLPRLAKEAVGSQSMAAIQAVIAANTLTHASANDVSGSGENGAVTPEDVAAWMADAGWSWSGDRWELSG